MRMSSIPKRAIALAAAVLALSLAGGAAFAQDDDRDRDRYDRSSEQDNDDDDRDRRRDRRDRHRTQQHDDDSDRDWRDDGRRDRDRYDDRRRDDRYDRRYDRRDRWRAWSRFRRSFEAPRRYRHRGYRPPRGFHYRRWAHGQHLPQIYFERRYWLTNFVLFGLFPPPPGLVWVRYGPDALLVDIYTGEIVQVRYNVFYFY